MLTGRDQQQRGAGVDDAGRVGHDVRGGTEPDRLVDAPELRRGRRAGDGPVRAEASWRQRSALTSTEVTR